MPGKIRTEKSYCRFCHAMCGIEVDIADGRAVAVRGDRDHPISQGFICIKGKQLPEQHRNPSRVTGVLRKAKGGDFETVPVQDALDEVARTLVGIIQDCGPRSVALYNGTKSWSNVSHGLAHSWLEGIGSPSYYTTATIDQPAKMLAPFLHGRWEAGHHDIQSSDVAMFIGSNPLRSFLQENLKLPCANTNAYLTDLVRGGLNLIVIDPRRTESAKKAVLHLAVRPGEDPTLLAGIIRAVIDEGLHDAEFVKAHADGFDRLRQAVDPFGLSYVEQRTGVPAADVIEAARIFGRGRRGGAVAGTGPNMAPHPVATELLICALNTICGRYKSAGEQMGHGGVLGAPFALRAQAAGPLPFDGYIEAPRVRGLRSLFFQQPTAALADEILTPGKGQVRALICNGGNPAVAFPDQAKIVRALQSLDLLVCLDVTMTPTAQLADYVFGCTLSLEKPDYTRHLEWYLHEPFAQYTPALVAPPAEAIHEWEFFWELAHRMRVPLSLGRVPFGPPVEGRPVNIDRKPDTESLMDLEASDGRISLDDVRRHHGGAVFDEARSAVAPLDPASAGRFELAPAQLVEELREIRAEPVLPAAGYKFGEKFTHRLISRRMLQVFNSTGTTLHALNKVGPGNPAFMNPEEMANLGIESGRSVLITSRHGQIRAIARAEAEIPAGVISIAHAWGDLPQPDSTISEPEAGSCTNRLVADDIDFEPILGMCRMSAIPVTVRPVT